MGMAASRTRGRQVQNSRANTDEAALAGASPPSSGHGLQRRRRHRHLGLIAVTVVGAMLRPWLLGCGSGRPWRRACPHPLLTLVLVLADPCLQRARRRQHGVSSSRRRCALKPYWEILLRLDAPAYGGAGLYGGRGVRSHVVLLASGAAWDLIRREGAAAGNPNEHERIR